MMNGCYTEYAMIHSALKMNGIMRVMQKIYEYNFYVDIVSFSNFHTVSTNEAHVKVTALITIFISPQMFLGALK